MTAAPPDRPCVRLPGHISVRGGKGLGDALYVQAVARHWVRGGQRVQVCTAWPEVYRPLASGVVLQPFTRLNVERVAHYTLRKHLANSTQFQDCCMQAGIREPVELRLDWTPATNIAARVQAAAAGLPWLLVAMPRPPMGRSDGFGWELSPDWAVYQRLLYRLAQRFFLVEVGSGPRIAPLQGIGLSLANGTTVPELLDLAQASAGLVGTVGHFVPLAESLGKRALILFSARGLASANAFVSRITPAKVLHGANCAWAVDNWTDMKINEAFHGVL